MAKFPWDFLWGAATSAYQVEGGNRNCDWWHWEKEDGRQRSGSACRHYELYEDDFDLVKKLNHNAHRFSIEWSRIQTGKNKFSRRALEHYRDVLIALRKRSIEPVVTLHHFTNPLWFMKTGGWVNPLSVLRFLRYCDFVVSELSPYVRYWVTINEPTIYISHAYIFGVWPPQAKSYIKATAVEENLAWAHVRAYRLIHRIYRRKRLNNPYVSIAQNVMAFVPRRKDLKNRVSAFLRDRLYNLGFFEILIQRNMMRKPMDFIGVNYYSRQVVDLKEFGIKNLAVDVCDDKHKRCAKNSLGWDIYPRGIYEVLLKLKRYDLPVMITENGICTANDEQRWKYIREHLKNVLRAMRKGARVIGYLYWSLMDNFEWDKGFAPRFGLINIDYATGKRTVRKSARKFAQVCKTGVLVRRDREIGKSVVRGIRGGRKREQGNSKSETINPKKSIFVERARGNGV